MRVRFPRHLGQTSRIRLSARMSVLVSLLYLSLYLPCEINNTQLKRRKLQPVVCLFSSPSVLLGCGERRKSSRKSPTSRKYWTKRLIALDCHCDLAGNIFDLVSHLSFRYRYIPVLLRTPPSIFTETSVHMMKVQLDWIRWLNYSLPFQSVNDHSLDIVMEKGSPCRNRRAGTCSVSPVVKEERVGLFDVKEAQSLKTVSR